MPSPRPAGPWFRFYCEVLNDPKILRLTDKEFRAWVLSLCIAAKNAGRIEKYDLGFHLRMNATKALHLARDLVNAGLFEEEGDDVYVPHNWKGRQYDVAERSESGSRGNHVRWHVQQGSASLDCPYCIAEGLAQRLAPPIAERVAKRRDTETDTETDTEQKQNRAEPPPLTPPPPGGAVVVVPLVRAFERCFGRLLSPMEIEQIKALEEEHPRERIDYALREAAELNKRNVRYIQRICENQEASGDSHERPASGRVAGTGGITAAEEAQLSRLGIGAPRQYVD